MSIMGFSPLQLILGAVGGSIAIFANFVALIMVGKVNEASPEAQRISYIWWNRDVLKRYEEL